MSQRKPQCAVVMSGHARMVPQGLHLLKDRFNKCERTIDYDIFSMVWTNASESKPVVTANQELQDQILSSLGTRHLVRDQQPEFEQMRQRFLAVGAIPEHDADSRGFRMPRETFYRFMGQVIGFCWALIYWRKELSQYDYIVRSRWDMCLDTDALNFLTNPRKRYIGEFDSFYTKSVEIVQGHIQISGDTIYGHTDQWMAAIQSMDSVIERIIQGTRLRWIDIQQRYSENWNLHGDYEKYYLSGWWFNSHFIWTALFAHTNISIRAAGESYGITSELADIPLDQLEFHHAVGQVYRPPETATIEDLQYVDTRQEQLARTRHIVEEISNQGQLAIERQRMVRAGSIRRRIS